MNKSEWMLSFVWAAFLNQSWFISTCFFTFLSMFYSVTSNICNLSDITLSYTFVSLLFLSFKDQPNCTSSLRMQRSAENANGNGVWQLALKSTRTKHFFFLPRPLGLFLRNPHSTHSKKGLSGEKIGKQHVCNPPN
jgi:hypothetical protein